MNVSNILFRNGDMRAVILPDKQLLDQSVLVAAPKKRFNSWSPENHTDSYSILQRIAQSWKTSNFTNQYLIYGKINSTPFHWEIVPYQKCRTFIGRIVQQLQVLWRTVFGGVAFSEKTRASQLERYKLLFAESPIEPLGTSCKSDDSFCKDATIQKQWVMTGKKVNVLFNYAPIGFGGERLHFLVIPKEHRETFTEVTREEYCESMDLTAQLVGHFSETRKNIKNVYLLNKTGVDAGQTVKHWHLHVIFSTNAAQDIWGKITIIKNILFGSSPMKKEDLAEKVADLREELKLYTESQ